MKKMYLMTIIVCTLLNGCAKYEPIIDTKGKSKFETSNASEISNDKILCEKLAKNNTTFFGNINFFLKVLIWFAYDYIPGAKKIINKVKSKFKGN